MQRRLLNILVILLFTQFFAATPLSAQISSFRLRQADSLFQQKQYTQSMELYRTVFSQKQYTPAMLLKMAFIEEGLHQTGQALYYLNLYYKVTNDKTALDKMEELAKKYNLEGYEQTDSRRALSFYRDHRFTITIAIAALAFFLASLSFYLKRNGQRPVASTLALLVLLAMLGVHINIGDGISAGIISHAQTYAMEGPSAGASVAAVLDAGHRVEVIGKRDVWVKVLWQGETVYIKEGNVLPVAL